MGSKSLQRYDSLVARDHALIGNLLMGMVITNKGVFYLDLSFIVTGTIRENKTDAREIKRKEINNILMLKKELIAVGYNPCEVDYMIKTSSCGVRINKLDSEELKKIETVLIEQLNIARQCIDFIGNSQ